MGFIESVKSVFTKYATFQGRSPRSEYWYFMLFNFLVSFMLILFAAFLSIAAIEAALVMLVLLILYSLATMIPSISVTVRRLHDTNHSGWWYWISFVPYVGPLVLLVFMCIRGTDGPNQYGPDPFGPHLQAFD